jgi:hypothetical protein
MCSGRVLRLAQVRAQRHPRVSLFCLRFAPLTVSDFFDHLWLALVNRSEFGSCVMSCLQKLVEFGMDSKGVAPVRSLYEELMIHTIKVAIACQSKVAGSKMNQKTP